MLDNGNIVNLIGKGLFPQHVDLGKARVQLGSSDALGLKKFGFLH